MRIAAVTAALALAAATPACTLASIGLTASVISTHNEIADSHWNYTTPILVSALVGAVGDAIFLLLIGKEWTRPMT